jgi:DNA-binding PadR family transcriptional regulator
MRITSTEEFLPLTPQTFYALTSLAGGVNFTGAEIAEQIKTVSQGVVTIGTGSSYKILRALCILGLAECPAPKVYRLTKTGAWWLAAETERLEQAAAAAQNALRAFSEFQNRDTPAHQANIVDFYS